MRLRKLWVLCFVYGSCSDRVMFRWVVMGVIVCIRLFCVMEK